MVYLLGQAFSSLGWGQLSQRWGWRSTTVLGLLIGAVGGLVAIVSVERRSFGPFLWGSLLIGVAVAAITLARFIASDVHPPAERARAISNVVLGGTVRAILGPLLAGAAARVAVVGGLEELSGPFVVTAVFLLAAGATVFALIRTEPRDVSREVLALYQFDRGNPGPGRSLAQIVRTPGAMIAMGAMVFGQVIMVMLMVITPLHMRGHQHELSSISFVISAHVVGMYAFSILSGSSRTASAARRS